MLIVSGFIVIIIDMIILILQNTGTLINLLFCLMYRKTHHNQTSRDQETDLASQAQLENTVCKQTFYFIFLRFKQILKKGFLKCCGEGGWPKQSQDSARSAWISQGASGTNSEQQSTYICLSSFKRQYHEKIFLVFAAYALMVFQKVFSVLSNYNLFICFFKISY